MTKRKQILTAILKSLLAGAETSALIKIPATFIAELAALPKDKRKALDTTLPDEQFKQLLTQSELSTTNAALTAATTEQIKILVSKLIKLSAEKLNALKTLTQNEFDVISTKLDDIAVTTSETNRLVKKLLAKREIDDKAKKAIEKIFLSLLGEENIPEWQWPEKLQEITQRHQELLDKWQTLQSGDPAVDNLRDKAHRMIELGEYDQADQTLQQAIEIDQKAIQSLQDKLDQRKISISQSLASRADIANSKLDYHKAIDLYQTVLEAFPQNQPNLHAMYLNNLGFLYKTIANYKEAEPLYRRALAINEKSYGPDHPKVTTALNNLAQLLKDTNRLAEAEPMLRRVITILENPEGEPLPFYAGALNNLATLFLDTNRLSEAEHLMKRALNIDEKAFGPDHPDVASDLNNLAQLLKATNRLAEAESFMKRALEISENSYGPDHPVVATNLNNLAQILKAINRFGEAEHLMKRALAIDEKSFGPNHPSVARDLNNIAAMLQGTNRHDEAESIFRRVIKLLENSGGEPLPHYADALNNLAHLLKATDRFAEAEPLMKHALEIDEKSFGPDHPDVARDLNNLSRLLQDTNRLAEAKPLMKRALDISEKSLGLDHPNTITFRNNLKSLSK